MQVEIWSDVVCPWCYLGKRRFERALGSFDHADEVDVVYRSFELDPTASRDVTTPTVELLATKYGMSVEDANGAQVQMTERAAAEGLDFHLSDLRSGNTRDAHRLLHLAKDVGLQVELTERLHRSYFVESGSVFDAPSLRALAVDVGMDPDEVQDVLTSARYDEDVETDEATASALGATGVPFFVVDRRYGLSGAQPTDVIAALLRDAWAEGAT
jgi:predicted DsbA family dithiol-disulfide isomerase